MSWEFVKIYRSILGSSVSNDVLTRHIFMDLLLLADQDGNIDMTPSAIARMTGNPKEAVERVIAALCEHDPESRTPDHDGRRLVPIEGQGFGWTVVNFRRYAEKGTSTERVRAHRERADAFIPPTVEEVAAEIKARGGPYLRLSADAFVAHYSSVGWVRGKTKIRSWRDCLKTWAFRDQPSKPKPRSLADMIRNQPPDETPES